MIVRECVEPGGPSGAVELSIIKGRKTCEIPASSPHGLRTRSCFRSTGRVELPTGSPGKIVKTRLACIRMCHRDKTPRELIRNKGTKHPSQLYGVHSCGALRPTRGLVCRVHSVGRYGSRLDRPCPKLCVNLTRALLFRRFLAAGILATASHSVPPG